MVLNFWPILAATVAMFAVGVFWYSVPFRKKWGEIHGFDKLSKSEQQKLMKESGPTYVVQLLVTVVSAWVLAALISQLPNVAPTTVAFWVWLGFVMPSQVSAVLFSRTEKRYKLQQVLIMSGEALVHLLVAAWVISLF